MIDPCIKTIFEQRICQLYDELQEVQNKGEGEQLNLDKYSYPFVPYIGRDYRNASPKIFYVGREPANWNDDVSVPQKTFLSEAVKAKASLDVLYRITENYVENHVIPSYENVAGKKERGRPFFG